MLSAVSLWDVGFWKLSKEVLLHVCRDECGLKVDAKTQRFDLAVAAVRSLLKLSDENIAAVLEPWVATEELSADEAALLASEEVQDLVDDGDRKAIADFIARATGNTDAAEEARKLRSLRPSAPPAKPRRKPINMPLRASMTGEQAGRFAPPTSRMYRDSFNCRWLIWYGRAQPPAPRWSASASWGVTRSDEDCIRIVLKRAWDRHTLLTGELCPFNLDDVSACAAV